MAMWCGPDFLLGQEERCGPYSLSLSLHVLFGFEESFKHKLQARDTFIKYSELLIPIQVFTAYIVYQRVIKLLIPIQTLLKFSGFSFYIPSHFQNQSFNYVILVKRTTQYTIVVFSIYLSVPMIFLNLNSTIKLQEGKFNIM